MKLYVCYNPRAVALARDENHARVMIRGRMRERGVNSKRRLQLEEVSTSVPRVVLPPSPEATHATLAR
jgi:hypothetical protein